jgi:hypothetical protein
VSGCEDRMLMRGVCIRTPIRRLPARRTRQGALVLASEAVGAGGLGGLQSLTRT